MFGGDLAEPSDGEQPLESDDHEGVRDMSLRGFRRRWAPLSADLGFELVESSDRPGLEDQVELSAEVPGEMPDLERLVDDGESSEPVDALQFSLSDHTSNQQHKPPTVFDPERVNLLGNRPRWRLSLKGSVF